MKPRAMASALPLLLTVVATARAEEDTAVLAARVQAFRARIERERAALREPRPPLFGADPVAGNAAELYTRVEQALSASAADADALRALNRSLRRRPFPTITPADRARAAKLAGIAPLVREALARERCAWDEALEQGFTERSPPSPLFLAAAGVLALLAEDAEEALEASSLALLAVGAGYDLSRFPSAIGFVIGTAVADTGVHALERALVRARSPEELSTMLGCLDRLTGLPPLDAVIRRELTGLAHEVAGLTERPGRGSLIELSVALNEWRVLDALEPKLAGFALRPAAERRRLTDRFDREVLDLIERSVVVGRAVPNVAVLADLADEHRTRLALVRLAARAKVFRARHGAWPEDVARLADDDGQGVPSDPFDQTRPLELTAGDGGGLRVTSSEPGFVIDLLPR
ncbi:MAG: hypothetical protein M9894_18430 [Planctomycetes bacterium]|nr:hypothetical protein [Planctomycetota bacterium]